MENITNIIWDWNGTLLNDVDICVDTMNSLLGKRQLPLMDLMKYRSVFDFPVIHYYELLGFDFDKEPYDDVAMEFINTYLQWLDSAELHSDVKTALAHFKNTDYKQSILSAMEQDTLNNSVSSKGISNYFTVIQGISDHYAHGKIGIAKEAIQKIGVNADEVILIGDTIHDHEVALEIGCECILVADGHQSPERLARTGRKVVNDLLELTSLIRR
jgi:phosphoglycolate phosphatase